MNNIIDEFITHMSEHGLAPERQSDIRADDKRHNYRLHDDPKNKKRGFYKLKVEGDFGVGFFGDYRTDECINWHSNAGKEYTAQEKQEFKEKLRAEKERQEKETRDTYTRKSEEAANAVLFLDECPQDHPYLLKKQIKPCGALIDGNDILLTMSDHEKLWDTQRITPGGDKLFTPGEKKPGTWFEIKGDETTIICEGYSTGCSIHEATGHTVIVAFNAANLAHVAKKIHKIHKIPKTAVIIAADNDSETVIRGVKKNIGVIKANEAAKIIGAKVCAPAICGDYNDLHVKQGLDAVKNSIQGGETLPDEASGGGAHLPCVDDLQPPAAGDDWAAGLLTNKKGAPLPRSTTNLLLILQNAPDLQGVFMYDSFSKRVLIHSKPPWEAEEDFKVRNLSDTDYIDLEAYLEKEWSIIAGKTKCADSIEKTCKLHHNVFNPASDYFNALEWDGTPRLETWLKDYVSSGEEPDEYLSMVGKKFLCGMAARAMEPGVKFDTMVIFEGDQYAGKSYLARILATINGEEYFLDDLRDIDNKDGLMKMQGKLIVEFPEISTMRKAEVDDLKAFVSRQVDEFRPPYGRNNLVAPRQCVFIGTVNPEGGYLRDATGNRRYWPVSCRKKIELEKIKEIVPQLHAEAAHLVKEGIDLWVSEEEYRLAEIQQEKRVVVDIWTDKIERMTVGTNWLATDDIISSLGITMDRASPLVHKRIKGVMSNLKWKPSRRRKAGAQSRGYESPNLKKQKDLYSDNEDVKW